MTPKQTLLPAEDNSLCQDAIKQFLSCRLTAWIIWEDERRRPTSYGNI